MKQLYKTTVSLVLGILAMIAIPVQAQDLPLRLTLPQGLPIIPIMEGWFANDDGSYTISFGFLNRNAEAVEVPVGANNFIEPAQLSGPQAAYFAPGRSYGAFAITIPANIADQDIWWHLKTGTEATLKVPGRSTSGAYELDRKARPQGSVQPQGWFTAGGAIGTGPEGIIEDLGQSVKVGSEVTLTIHTKDPSMRDASDSRFKEAMPSRLVWVKHQGPGDVEFTRHESTVVVEQEEQRGRRSYFTDKPEVVIIQGGEGIAKVNATFSEPGEYVVKTLIDNWRAPDSSGGDQCCWTNLYQRITVTP
ncbi:MAG: hypothetical protein COC19_06315 [SAR86 cluster bacterium]|uniref:Uncharacterized protein n=1 Tax=SAR86 cluster bacterium TaxID=2030880 RepID=A0A2A4MJS8_9GAMM|nr:MAG: hypothetical protein COC19_06315 [SAR86 cluster bacterium]